MAVYTISRYPREVELRDRSRVCLRPMQGDDVPALLEFFRRIPEEERFFLNEDVTSPSVVQGWADHLDYDRVLPLLAFEGERIIADAVLIRQRGGSRRHAAEIRIVVDPEHEGRGLGVTLTGELLDIANDAEIEFAVFELLRDVQDRAIEAVEFLGALPAGTVHGLVKDQHGKAHDLVFKTIPLGKWWQWSHF